jgi:hypothetical protein
VIPVIDEQEAATIKAETFEAIDNTGERIDLAKDAWDLIRK